MIFDPCKFTKQPRCVGALMRNESSQIYGTVQGSYRLHYHRTLGGCNPVEAFLTGSEGALAEWLYPYDGLTDSCIAHVAQQLGLQRTARPCKPQKRARMQLILPWTHDSKGEHLIKCLPDIPCWPCHRIHKLVAFGTLPMICESAARSAGPVKACGLTCRHLGARHP
jgi:hypothetical protein